MHLLKYHKTNFNRHKNVTNKMQFRYAHTHVSLKDEDTTKGETQNKGNTMLATIISVCRCNLSKKYMIARSRRRCCSCCCRRHHFTHIDFNFNVFSFNSALCLSRSGWLCYGIEPHTYFMHTIAVIGIVENLLWD